MWSGQLTYDLNPLLSQTYKSKFLFLIFQFLALMPFSQDTQYFFVYSFLLGVQITNTHLLHYFEKKKRILNFFSTSLLVGHSLSLPFPHFRANILLNLFFTIYGGSKHTPPNFSLFQLLPTTNDQLIYYLNFYQPLTSFTLCYLSLEKVTSLNFFFDDHQ